MEGATKNSPQAKEWDALTADEKMERMRVIIKETQNSLHYANNQIYKLRQKLSRHQHIDNKVVEMKEIGSYDDEIGSNTPTCLSNVKFF